MSRDAGLCLSWSDRTVPKQLCIQVVLDYGRFSTAIAKWYPRVSLVDFSITARV